MAGARVVAEVVEQGRDAKILVFKKKRRKNHRRLRGHRQNLTVLRITDILTADEAKVPVAPAEASGADATAPAGEAS